VTLNIKTNDSDPDGNITGFDLNTNTSGMQNTISNSQGIFSVNNNGQLIFIPANNFTGTATLKYQAIDNTGATSNTADINIPVTAIPENPIIPENPPIIIDPQPNNPNNNTPIDLEPSQPGIQTNINTSAGSVSINSNSDNSGSFSFVPKDGLTGSITIPMPTQLTNSSNGQIDLDPNQPGSQTFVTTTQGLFSVDTNGNLVFDPAPGFTGTAILPYQLVTDVVDLDPTQPGIQTDLDVSIPEGLFTIDNTNNGINSNGSFSFVPNSGSTGKVNIPLPTQLVNNSSGQVIDLNPDQPGVQSNITTSQGAFSLDQSGNLIFQPAPNFSGTATLPYQLLDSTKNSLNLDLDPSQPGMQNIFGIPEGFLSIDSSGTINFTPTDNLGSNLTFGANIFGHNSNSDFDIDPTQPGRQSALTLPQGVFQIDKQGNLVFAPVEGFTGKVSLPYQIFDQSGNNKTSLISLNINPVGLALNPNVDLNPTQPGVQNSFTIPEGVLSIDINNTFHFTPSEKFTDSLILGANTLGHNSNSDFDIDPTQPGRQSILSVPQGVFNIDGQGNLIFTPAPGFTGKVSLPYQIFDQSGNSQNDLITLNINPTSFVDQDTGNSANNNTGNNTGNENTVVSNSNNSGNSSNNNGENTSIPPSIQLPNQSA
ncbi:MAG: Ig-like domain-containing protein, partial [Microcoleaceae cyanobacterium]